MSLLKSRTSGTLCYIVEMAMWEITITCRDGSRRVERRRSGKGLCVLEATKAEDLRLTDDSDKIHVDATQPATLNDGAGVPTDCPTLGEAITAWQRLLPEQKIRATIKVIGGRVYTAQEIVSANLASTH